MRYSFATNFFPRIARGHTSGYGKNGCASGGHKCGGEARYSQDKKSGAEKYVDGHTQSQSVAERAHFEGLR